jgi:cell division protein FtsB
MHYTQKKSIENAHIVRERDRRRFRELLAVLSLGIPIGLFLLLFTWQSLEVIRLGREANRLQQQRKQIEDANKALQLQLDRLTSFDAVETKANALGFTPTDPRAIVQVVTPSVSEGAGGAGGALAGQSAAAPPPRPLATLGVTSR